MRTFNRIVLLALFIFVIAAVTPGTVSAQDPGWRFTAEVYLWGASVGGKTASDSDIDIDFDDILENLKMGFMGAVGAQKGKWLFLADAIYLDVEDDTTVGPGIRLDGELSGWIVQPMVGYNLAGSDKFNVNIVGGARYLYLDAKLELGPLREEESGSVWDAVVGFRGHADLTEKWYLTGHLDIGTGESDFTWQALGGIGYRFKWFDLIGAYRYLSWDFDDGGLLDDLELHGPFVGIKFGF